MKDKLALFLFGTVLMFPLFFSAYIWGGESIEIGSHFSFSLEVWQFMLCIFCLSQLFYFKKILSIFVLLRSNKQRRTFKMFMSYSRVFPVWVIVLIAMSIGGGLSESSENMRIVVFFMCLLPLLFYMVWVDIWFKKNLPNQKGQSN